MVEITVDDTGGDEYVLDYVSDTPSDAYEFDIPKPNMDESFPRALFFHGAPVVGAEKIPKLKEMLEKMCKKAADDRRGQAEVEIKFDTDANGGTTGCGFVLYRSTVAVRNALDYFGTSGIKFGGDMLHFYALDEVNKLLSTPENFDPQDDTYDDTFYNKDLEREWLLDSKNREQILLRHHEDTEILWNDPDERAPVLIYGGEREKAKKKIWCNSLVQWSKQGSFLLTFHPQGIAQWRGDTFEKVNRYVASQVQAIDFSPDEEFIMTWNGNTNTDDPESFCIFETRTGELKKTFKCPEAKADEDAENGYWKWSPDGKFLARMSHKYVYVYDVKNNFKLLPQPQHLDKFYGNVKAKKDEKIKGEPIPFDNLMSFSWSPTDNIIAAWMPEKGDKPARLALMEIPSRTELQSKNLFSVRDATMYWQSEGEYLCAMVSRLSKSGKSAVIDLKILNMKKKNIPEDILKDSEISGNVKFFAWEPRGKRFAILTTTEDEKQNLVQFYKMGDTVEKICELNLGGASCYNNISWAPHGSHFILSAMGSGEIQFCTLTDKRVQQANGLTETVSVATRFSQSEHFMLSDVLWDPSSRFVITAVTTPQMERGSAFRYNSETGFTIWSFQGRKLYKGDKEKLYQVAWRPHPPTLLPSKKIESMLTDMKRSNNPYSRKYDQIDEAQKEDQRKHIAHERSGKVRALEDIIERVEQWKLKLHSQTRFDQAWRSWRAEENFEDTVDVIETELEKSEEELRG